MKDFWFKLSDKIRFLIVGCFNAGVSYLIYVLFCVLLGSDKYQFALAISWGLSSIVSFCTQKFFVFQSRGIWFKEYIKCCTTWFLSYLINAFLLELLIKFINLTNVFVAQIIATFMAGICTYILFKKFAFTNIIKK